MPYRLIGPSSKRGRAKGYKVYYARIGQREISTGAVNKGDADRFAREAERKFYERDRLGERPALTVRDAVINYTAFRRPSKLDRGYLDKVSDYLSDRPIDQISQTDFDEAARNIYPGRTNETWNRQVYTPLQAALRHAGIAIVLKRPKQKKPRHRGLSAKQRDILIKSAASDTDLQALLTVLFYAGPRISEAISLTRDRVDFKNKRICFDVAKTDMDHWRPLHQKAASALQDLKIRQGGQFFRWATRSGPNKAIKALSKRTGIHFSPHMARHTFANLLIDAGAEWWMLKEAGGWESDKAVKVYAGRNVDHVRNAINKL